MSLADAPSDRDTFAVAPTVLPASERFRILLYFGGLTVILALADPAGGLLDIPLSFYLKNRLGLTAKQVAIFQAIAGLPLVVAFLFGLARDRWNLLGRRDRGLMLVFGAVCAALYLGFAFAPMSYDVLLLAIFLITACTLFMDAAESGLASVVGQQHAMPGQMSATWSAFSAVPAVGALLLGGYFSDWLEHQDGARAARALFLVGAATSLMIVLYATLRPRAVFDGIRDERLDSDHPMRDLRRLLRHRPIYPALIIWMLWNFAPGSSTPLQYYLQNTLKAPDSVWGQWSAIFAASFVPTYILFAWLCTRVSLKKLLWWGTFVAIPQFVPLLFITSTKAALIAAVPMGLMGGMATAAYLDLMIRSCPPRLQGTAMMASSCLFYVSSHLGDIWGAHLYETYGGFTICVAMITFAYALIVPVLLTVSDELTALPDNEVAPAGRINTTS